MNYNNNDNIHLYYELWDEDDIVDMLAYINKKHNLSLNIVDFDIDKCNNYNDLLCKLTCTE
jgi:hypothetical protein